MTVAQLLEQHLLDEVVVLIKDTKQLVLYFSSTCSSVTSQISTTGEGEECRSTGATDDALPQATL